MKFILMLLFFLVASRCPAAEAYIVSDGTASVVSLASAPEVAGLRPVTVAGAVHRPGIYLVSSAIPLAELLRLAGPRSEGFRADMTKVRIISVEAGVAVAPVVINAKRLLESGKKDELWILRGSEIIAVPEMFE